MLGQWLMSRTLYLIAYDVSDNATRARVCRYLKSYRVSGQKSVPEIWVTPAELVLIQRDLDNEIDAATDRIQLFPLDPRMHTECRGKGTSFRKPHFLVV